MTAAKRPKVTTPARGKPWPPRVVKRALELMRETLNVTAARKLLSEAFEFSKDAPARSTLQAWAKKDGIELDVDPSKTRDTTAATDARLARLEQGRSELSELLLEKLSRPAVEEIANRLQEAKDAEELVATARETYQDALKTLPMAREMDQESPGAYKGAWEAVGKARAELAFAMDFRIGVRELVGIVTRALGDHLALEGLGVDEEALGDLIVEHVVPRPDRRKADEMAVPQAKLRVVDGGG